MPRKFLCSADPDFYLGYLIVKNGANVATWPIYHLNFLSLIQFKSSPEMWLCLKVLQKLLLNSFLVEVYMVICSEGSQGRVPQASGKVSQ